MTYRPLPNGIDYHTGLHSDKYCFEYLKKINPKLDEYNYLTYAFLATNPTLTNETREVYRRMMEQLYMMESSEIEELKQRALVPHCDLPEEKYNDNVISNDDIHRQ